MIEELDVYIYPNPAQEFVNIKLNSEFEQDYNIQLIDYAGRIVYLESEVQNSNSVIDVTVFPPGIYLVKIDFGQTSYTDKLILK